MKWLLLLIPLVGYYIAKIICDYLIFHPTKCNDEIPKKVDKFKVKSSYVMTPDNESIHYVIINNDDSDKIFLLAHGNAGNIYCRLRPMSENIKYLLKYGSVCLFDYRGYGKSSGKESESGIRIDIETMWNHLSKTHDNIILYGESLGCSFVSWLGSHICKNEQSMPKCIILQSGFYNLNEMGTRLIGRVASLITPFLSQDFNNMKYIKNIKTKIGNYPILILHSKRDEIIPYIQAKQLSKETISTLVNISGSHNSPQFPEKLDELMNSII